MDDSFSPDKSFDILKKNTLKAISDYFPDGKYTGHKQTVHLGNLRVEDKIAHDNVTSQAEAKDKESTWGAPIKADLKLVDNATGKIIDEKKGAVLARLPKLTNRYGYIVDGNEYQVDHLFRLKSGAYTRVQANGDLETEYNCVKGINGRGFSVKFDGAKNLFSIKMDSSHIPLYPVLKSMGVADDDLEKDWGKQILAANKPKSDEKFEKHLQKFWQKTSEDGADQPKDLTGYMKHVQDVLGQTVIRPDSTKVTLGKAFTTVNGDCLRRGAAKVLGLAATTVKPDDRDSLAFKEVVSAEDVLPERIEHANRNITSRLRMMVDHKSDVGEIVPSDLFNRPIREFFTKGGGLTERSDQSNPIQMLSAHRKTTLMAKEAGGIKSGHQLTPEMQTVNQSHFGFLDPMATPESEKTGITMELGANVRKSGRDLEAPVYNVEKGKFEYLKVPDFHAATAVLPDQVRWVKGKPVPVSPNVKVKLPEGEIAIRPFKDAQYVMPSAKGIFNYTSNLIPFLPCDNGNRVSYANKHLEQAIGLKDREPPLVQSKTDRSITFEKLMGDFAASNSPVDGKVIGVKPNVITIQDGKEKHEIHIYDHFPLNDTKGVMHSEALVKVGDTVKKGQTVADNNYTKNGVLSIGTNLRVGYIPYKGYNFDDGIVISETASKKLTSEHLYKKDIEINPDSDHVSKAKYRAHMLMRVNEMPKSHWDSLGEDGIIKPGTILEPGQVMVAALGKNEVLKKDHSWGALGGKAIHPYKDKSLVWDEDHAGEVIRVVKQSGGRGVKVYVKTMEQAAVGDKLSGRHGNKGIITQILPDHEMPFTKNAEGEKRSLEILLNPSGVPTRINVGCVLETAAAKIAEKTGKPYIVDNFSGPGHDYRKQVEDELKKHGISDQEEVFDPQDVRRPIGSVLVGPQYILKLKHQVEKKLSARGGGTTLDGGRMSYDPDKQPHQGGEHGGQGFGQLEMYCLLGHNARNNIREMATYKGDMQDQSFWALIQAGQEPPTPKPSFAYNKFSALLRGVGVNMIKEGTTLRLQPITDKEIRAAAGNGRNEIKNAKTVQGKNLKPYPGGLYDDHITGGVEGDKWSFIRLAEPIPNPIFVGQGVKPGPVPVLLGLKLAQIDAIMEGKETLDGKTGGTAIEHALKKINVDKELVSIKKEMAGLTGSPLDRANKKARYLMALKEAKLEPAEAYIFHSIPVLPPKFRPANPTPSGDVNFHPTTGLYKNIFLLNEQLGAKDEGLSKEHKHPLRSQLWDSIKALEAVGSYKPVYDMEAKGNRALPGVLDIIGRGGIEGQPKEGYFQSKLVKRKLDLSMRSTIVPEPALHIDQVGLPKNAAMEMYKPFVVAQMGRWNIPPLQAQEHMRKGSDLAVRALNAVVAERPVILKRDPALHKFSVMAFHPVIVGGKAIQIHPLVCGGYNADFDGDTMAATVPMSKAAVAEANGMVPSKNLFSPTHFGTIYNLEQEQVLGLHYLGHWGKKTNKVFDTIEEAKKAVDKGDIHITDVIKLKGGAGETTVGRLKIAEHLPPGFAKNKAILHDPDFAITKKSLEKEIATPIARQYTDHYAKTIDNLKNLGNEYAYKLGLSFSLKDFATLPGRDAILKAANTKADAARKDTKNQEELDKKLINIYSNATTEIDAAVKKDIGNSSNRLGRMVFSGSRGKPEQLRQMVAAPMLMQDSLNKTIPTPVTRSFAEGLDLGEYWLTQHGARKGTLQKASGTSDPGSVSKDIINSTLGILIHSKDCGTNQGVLMDVTHPDIHDRFLAAPYKLKDGTVIKEGTLLTSEIIGKLDKHDKNVLVRSPLKCAHGDGICSKCFGLNENGVLHDVGTNIGVLAGQALGEPTTQLSMRVFHTGGVAAGAGSKSMDMFERLKHIVGLPKTLPNSATLAQQSGVISSIKSEKAHDIITVGDEQHTVAKHLVNPNLKVGTEVKKGDRLSEGNINPLHLLATTKDINAVQNYLTSALHSPATKDKDQGEGEGLYQGLGVRRRNVEVVVRAMTNLTKVRDPAHSDWLHGDVLPRSVVDEYNHHLAKGQKPVEHDPILKGISEIPSFNPDWMARLNYQELPTTLQRAAAQGHRADIHSSHPIAGMAYGAEFGKGHISKKPHVY